MRNANWLRLLLGVGALLIGSGPLPAQAQTGGTVRWNVPPGQPALDRIGLFRAGELDTNYGRGSGASRPGGSRRTNEHR
jgi:hypothetical protein